MTHPVSTYRLQIRADFDLDAAAEVASYLQALGVDWAYLSPILEAADGSDHGYDVVDTSRVDPARGGAEGLARFRDAARAAGLGILVDIVPNHMGVADPSRNRWWWDVLTHGRSSRHAEAFDVDWEHGSGRLRLPILGAELGEVLAAGELTVDADAGVVRYYDTALPLAPGSLDGVDAADVRAVLQRQHWELMHWRRDEDLNYRRFFTVTSLAGVRVETEPVFAATHAEVGRWFREGLVDGLRIDHPDGLADPGGYLTKLAELTGGAHVVVEKILEHGEQLPGWWATAGTTGYDAMAEIDRVLVDPAGADALDALDARLRAETDLAPLASYADLIHDTKRAIAETALRAEVRRLARLLPAELGGPDGADALDALAELLANFPVYRAYLPAGAEHLAHAVAETARRRPDLAERAAAVADRLLADPHGEFATRFMQTTGPVMAKGVEDTAFYRYTRLGTLTEVGGDPSVFALDIDGFHAAAGMRQSGWPHASTALSTHDTKRSEDVRARLSVLAEMPERWAETLGRLRAIATTGNGPFDALLWQAIVGAWPASPERLHAYAEKAARESAEDTTWADPDAAFEARVRAVVDAAFGTARPIVEAFVGEIAGFGWSNALSAKLLQLAAPGVPDVYQGTELWDLSLVDPDNRRAVDYAVRRDLLARIDAGWTPGVDETGAAKLLVTSRALRLRRDRAELFTRYTPLPVAGPAADHAVAFDRGEVIAVATRLPAGLVARGGWGDTVLLLPPGAWQDELTGRRHSGGEAPLAALLAAYPVALLRPADAAAPAAPGHSAGAGTTASGRVPDDLQDRA